MEDAILEVRREKETAIEVQDFEKAAALRDRERKLLNQRRELEDKWQESDQASEISIGEDEIAEVTAMWTGIPVTKLTEAETHRLLRMEEALHARVVGQDEPVKAVSRAIRRSRAGLKDPHRPGGSFIFLGPSGVGKTELARTLAEFLFGDEAALIQVDMSEYMEKHAVSRLVGSPPGYVGYDEGGQLTESVRRRPYSVVLLDEIEKAHPDVFNILLQILEDGRLTDAQGRTVDFRNCIVIMTSNIGASTIAKGQVLGFGEPVAEGGLEYEEMKTRVTGELKKMFKPEFLNRVDEVIVFRKLTRAEIADIVALMMARVEDQLKDREIGLALTPEAKELLVDVGYDPTMGARPFRRAIQRHVEDLLAEEVLSGPVPAGQHRAPGPGRGPSGHQRGHPRRAGGSRGRRVHVGRSGPCREARAPSSAGSCGYVSPGWLGRCPGCGRWNTIAEAAPQGSALRLGRPAGSGGARRPYAWPTWTPARTPASTPGLDELKRVLGGGLVAGCVVLLGGEAGVGKSTLLRHGKETPHHEYPMVVVLLSLAWNRLIARGSSFSAAFSSS